MLLAGAYLFQALGYAPCQMCFWQRYPHMLAIAIGALIWFWPSRLLAGLGALAALTDRRHRRFPRRGSSKNGGMAPVPVPVPEPS